MPLPRPKLFRKKREPKERPNVVSRLCTNLVFLLTSCFKTSDSTTESVKVAPKRSKSFIAKIKKSSAKVGVIVDDGEQPGPSGYQKYKNVQSFKVNSDTILKEPRGIWTPVEKFEILENGVETIERTVECRTSVVPEITADISLNANREIGLKWLCKEVCSPPNNLNTEESVPLTFDVSPNENGLKEKGIAEDTDQDTDQDVVATVKMVDEPTSAESDSYEASNRSPDHKPIELESSTDKLKETVDDRKDVPFGLEPNESNKEADIAESDIAEHDAPIDVGKDVSSEAVAATEYQDLGSARCCGVKDEISGDHPVLRKVPSQASGFRCKSPVARRSCLTPKYIYLNNAQTSQSFIISRPNSTLETISETDILKEPTNPNDCNKDSSHYKIAQSLSEDMDHPSRYMQVMQVSDMRSNMTHNELMKCKSKGFNILDRPKTSCRSKRVVSMRSMSTVGCTIEEEEDIDTNNGNNLLNQPSQCIPLNAQQHVQQSERSMNVDVNGTDIVEEDENPQECTKGDDLEEQIYNDILSSVLRETVTGIVEGSITENGDDIDRISKVLSDEAIRQALEEESSNLPSELGSDDGAITEIAEGKVRKESDVCHLSFIKDGIDGNSTTTLNFDQTSANDGIDDTADMSALLECLTEEAIRDAFKGATATEVPSIESVSVVAEQENSDVYVQDSSNIADNSAVDETELEKTAKQLVEAALNNVVSHFLSCQ